jgi:hypothetical protein
MGASRSARCGGRGWRNVIESEGWGYGGGDAGSISDRREGDRVGGGRAGGWSQRVPRSRIYYFVTKPFLAL